VTTAIDEIAEGIYRVCTYLPDAAPDGFTFNQFLIDAEEPLLFHTGPRRLFPDIAEAVGRVMDLDRLRWISFGHLESDECGSMNRWLHSAPDASLAVGQVSAQVSIADLADRTPVEWADGASAGSTRPTCSTAGTPACCSRRSPARSWPATSSPIPAVVPRCATTT